MMQALFAHLIDGVYYDREKSRIEPETCHTGNADNTGRCIKTDDEQGQTADRDQKILATQLTMGIQK